MNLSDLITVKVNKPDMTPFEVYMSYPITVQVYILFVAL